MGLTEVIGECWGAMKRNLGRTAAVLLASAALSCGDNDDSPSYVPPAPAPATVIHTDGSTQVSEEGSTSDSYGVVLDSQPSEDVTIDLSYGFQVTGDKASLLFTPLDWDVPQTVTVSAVDDSYEETNPHTAKVAHVMTSPDEAFNNKSFYSLVNVLENDGAFRPPAPATFAESGGSTEVSEEGSTSDSYDVVLDHQPSGDVTVTLSVGSQVSVDKASLLFTPLNWDVPQTVTVSAIDDLVDETNPHAGNVHHEFSSSDYRFNNKIRDLYVSVLENDGAFQPPAPVTVTETGGSTEVNEEGPTSDSYDVVLDHQPSGDVTVTLSVGSQVSVDKASLLFTPLNWDVPQTVTVSAIDDIVKESSPHMSDVQHFLSSSDYRFNNKDFEVVVKILDNEGVAQVRGRIASMRSEGVTNVVRQIINPDGSGKSEVLMAESFAPVGWSWNCDYLGLGGRTSVNYQNMIIFNNSNALVSNLTDDTHGSHVEWHPVLYNLVVPTASNLELREWVLGDPSVDTPSSQILKAVDWGWYFYRHPQYSPDGMKVAFVKQWSGDSGATYTNLDILVGDYGVPLSNVKTIWSGSCKNTEPVSLQCFQNGSDYAVIFTEGSSKQLHMVNFDGSNNFVSEQAYSLSDFTWADMLNFTEGPRCRVSPDGNLAVVVDYIYSTMPSSSDPNKAVVFDLNTGVREATILGNADKTYFHDACFGPDSRMLLLGGGSYESYTLTGGFLTILDYQTGEGKTIDAPSGKEVRFVDWGEDMNTYTFELPETSFPGSTYQ